MKKNSNKFLGVALGFSGEVIIVPWFFYKLGDYLTAYKGWSSHASSYLALFGLMVVFLHLSLVLRRL